MVDAARHDQVTTPLCELAHRVVDGNQRTGTRRIDRVGGALQVEAVGNPGGREIGDKADGRLRVLGTQALLELFLHSREILFAHPREKTAQALHQLLRRAHALV